MDSPKRRNQKSSIQVRRSFHHENRYPLGGNYKKKQLSAPPAPPPIREGESQASVVLHHTKLYFGSDTYLTQVASAKQKSSLDCLRTPWTTNLREKATSQGCCALHTSTKPLSVMNLMRADLLASPRKETPTPTSHSSRATFQSPTRRDPGTHHLERD